MIVKAKKLGKLTFKQAHLRAFELSHNHSSGHWLIRTNPKTAEVQTFYFNRNLPF